MVKKIWKSIVQYEACHKKMKQSLNRPGQALRFPVVFNPPRFQDNQQKKVVRLSALITGRPYSPPIPRKYSWYKFLLAAVSS